MTASGPFTPNLCGETEFSLLGKTLDEITPWYRLDLATQLIFDFLNISVELRIVRFSETFELLLELHPLVALRTALLLYCMIEERPRQVAFRVLLKFRCQSRSAWRLSEKVRLRRPPSGLPGASKGFARASTIACMATPMKNGGP